MKIVFEKCHGLENDYLFIDLFKHPPLREIDLPHIARELSHRKRGPGADGLVLFGPSKSACALMRIFNSDGSEAEICGNALRCVARILYEEYLHSQTNLKIETLAGTIHARIIPSSQKSISVELNMGLPRWNRSDVPMIGEGEAINILIPHAGRSIHATCLSVGNPHCVVWNPESGLDDIRSLGPIIETHPLFPQRINVEFVRFLRPDLIRVDVWERGSGITAACGTGATAAFAVGRRLKLLESTCIVELPGGSLEFHDIDGVIFMRGPAMRVYRGECDFPISVD